MEGYGGVNYINKLMYIEWVHVYIEFLILLVIVIVIFISVVEIDIHIGISERVNILESQVKSLNYCINQLNLINENCVEHELRNACMDSIFILEHAVKKTTIQLFNMKFISHDFRDYFLKVTEIRLKLIHLENKFLNQRRRHG
ncbi:MAG: hypothetical protein K0S80_5190 [Neobacillus sp.]|nr:hypothetical protein [Neobacillus sp.]